MPTEVRAVATPAVIESMRKSSAPDVLQAFWQPRFPGQIPDDNPVADPLDRPSFELEGHQLVAVDVGHTDTDNSTVLHVPEIGLVAAGDAAYNGVHQYLAESDSQGRQDWLAALDVIEALDPRAVVAGHKRYGNDDSPRIIGETRQYIAVGSLLGGVVGMFGAKERSGPARWSRHSPCSNSGCSPVRQRPAQITSK
jgi:glyoxylase-like metal-dependent hydrolase (beta-lactamase superfamily II)